MGFRRRFKRRVRGFKGRRVVRKARGVMRKFRRKWKRAQKVVLGGLIIPDTVVTKLRSVYNFNFNAAALATAAAQWRGNSCYDPDFTGVGLTVPGFREYMNFFQKCTVLGSAVRWEVCGTSTQPIHYSLWPWYDSTTDPIETGTFKPDEQRYCRQKLCSGTTSGSNNHVILKNYMSTAKIFGVSPRMVKDEENFSHVTNTNPATGYDWYWRIVGYDSAGGAQTATVRIHITYYCLFRKRRDLYGQVL